MWCRRTKTAVLRSQSAEDASQKRRGPQCSGGHAPLTGRSPALDLRRASFDSQNSSVPATWPMGKMCRGGCADRFQRVDWRAFGAVAGAEDLDDPLAGLEVEGFPLEQRASAGDDAFLGAAEGVAQVLDG
jgi:hypothetical protein